jgi:hypothetical protein
LYGTWSLTVSSQLIGDNSMCKAEPDRLVSQSDTIECVYRYSLGGLQFSHDGSTVYGWNVVDDLEPTPNELHGSASSGSTYWKDEPIHIEIEKIVARYQVKELTTTSRGDSAIAGLPRLTLDSLSSSKADPSSLLKFDHCDGSIRGPGSIELTKLPRISNAPKTSIEALPVAMDDNSVRLIWTKSAQESYSVLDLPDHFWPAIIERQRSSFSRLGDDPCWIDPGSILEASKSMEIAHP